MNLVVAISLYCGGPGSGRHPEGGRRLIVGLDRLVPNPNQPNVNKAHVERIKSTINSGTKMPPIDVVKDGDKFRIIDGHHRYYAMKELGIKRTRVRVAIIKNYGLDAGGPGSGRRPEGGRSVRWRQGKKDGWSLRQKFIEVPIARVKPSQMNAPLNKEVVQRYFEQMRQGNLVTTPKAFRQRGGTYVLDDGHHRFAAAQRFGAKTIKLQVLT
jgi:ParB-like chromosome segregation protein Spo0J